MSKRNKRAGNAWELECIKKVVHIYPNLVSSRSESRNRDSLKVDLTNRDADKHGKCNVNIQCKTTCNSINYEKVLKAMPEERDEGIVNVIFHKKTKKKKEGKLFRETGQYAILELDDFISLLEELESLRNTTTS